MVYVFAHQISQFRNILEGLDFYNVGLFYLVFYGSLVYFVVIWYMYPHFGMLSQEKFGNLGCGAFMKGRLSQNVDVINTVLNVHMYLLMTKFKFVWHCYVSFYLIDYYALE
jgi:hypothetical protein